MRSVAVIVYYRHLERWISSDRRPIGRTCYAMVIIASIALLMSIEGACFTGYTLWNMRDVQQTVIEELDLPVYDSPLAAVLDKLERKTPTPTLSEEEKSLLTELRYELRMMQAPLWGLICCCFAITQICIGGLDIALAELSVKPAFDPRYDS